MPERHQPSYSLLRKTRQFNLPKTKTKRVNNSFIIKMSKLANYCQNILDEVLLRVDTIPIMSYLLIILSNIIFCILVILQHSVFN